MLLVMNQSAHARTCVIQACIILHVRTWKVAGLVSLSRESRWNLPPGEGVFTVGASLLFGLRPILGTAEVENSRFVRWRRSTYCHLRRPGSPRDAFVEPTWHAQRSPAARGASSGCQVDSTARGCRRQQQRRGAAASPGQRRRQRRRQRWQSVTHASSAAAEAVAQVLHPKQPASGAPRPPRRHGRTRAGRGCARARSRVSGVSRPCSVVPSLATAHRRRHQD